ncbi:MAG: lipase maturation factor family protein [Acidobacteria bacterium]|nr:lipase maturation factor family protein [Acidobacteriota bacterium]
MDLDLSGYYLLVANSRASVVAQAIEEGADRALTPNEREARLEWRRVDTTRREAVTGVTDLPAKSYRLTRWLFLRLVAVVSCIAFISYGLQIEGLIGSEGLLPVGDYLESADAYLAAQRAAGETGGRWLLPTLCWLAHSDVALEVMVWGGAGLSVLLMLGFAQGPLLLSLWVLYLSLMVVGQTFLSFQWDSLLLETLLFSLFVAPWSLRPRRPEREPEPWPLGVFMLRLLLFKLLFLSGVVKLLSMDDVWWQLGALDVHYFTQPLPAWTSWYAHQLPGWCQQLSVLVMFVIELAVPCLIFLPRRPRLAAVVPLVGFQILIAATGNYGFFNLLTIVLCIPLLDDRALLRLSGAVRWLANRGEAERSRSRALRRQPGSSTLRHLRTVLATSLIAISALTLVREMIRTYPRGAQSGSVGRALGLADGLLLSWAQPWILDRTDRFRSISGYGLFRAMTVERPEIVVEGSADGIRWVEIDFRWKPGDPRRRPTFTGPHMPRLDWQMWFAALDPPRATPWLTSLAQALLEGNEAVLDLLDRDTLPREALRYVRFQLYDYRFTTPEEKRRSGNWWARSPRGQLLARPLTREDFALARLTPHHAEADRQVAAVLPLRFDLEPGVVDAALVHLDQREARFAPGLDVVTHQVDVGIDRHWVSVGMVEVGRHAGRHDEERVVADEHEPARGSK